MIPEGYELNILVLLLYFGAVMFIGLYAWRKFPQSDPESYILGGRGIGWVVAAFTLMATQYSALTVLGFPGTIYRTGLGGYVAICGMYIGFAAMYWMLFAAKTWKVGRAFGHMTPGETFSHFYGSKAVGYVVGAMLIASVIPYIQAQILGIGFLFDVATGGMITDTSGAILVYGLIMIYVFLGGMRAVALTDTLQGVLLVAGLVGGALLVAYAVAGGIGASFTSVRDMEPALLGMPGPGEAWPWLYLMSWVIPVGVGWTMHPHMWIRMHVPRTVNFIRLWPMWVVISFPIVMGAALIAGIAGQAVRPGETDPAASDTMMINLILDNFPAVLAGLVAAAGLAAMMSSVSSQIHGVGASVSRDFLAQLYPDQPPSQQVFYTRIAVLVVGLIGLYLSLTRPDFLATIGAFAAAWGAQAAPVAVAALMGWRWATKWGAIAAVIGGTTVMLYIGITLEGQRWLGIYAGMWGMIASAVLFVLVSLATSASRPNERVVKEYQLIGW